VPTETLPSGESQLTSPPPRPVEPAPAQPSIGSLARLGLVILGGFLGWLIGSVIFVWLLPMLVLVILGGLLGWVFGGLIGGPLGLVALLGLVSLGGFLGCVIGAFIGVPLGRWLDPADPNAFMDLSGLEFVAWGGIIGLFAGAIGLPLTVSRTVSRRRAPRSE
jgi:hypothetical protein